MTETAFDPPASLEHYERTRLEKLLLATEAILELAEHEVLPMPLESELSIFRDRVQVALLRPETAADLLRPFAATGTGGGDG